MASSVELFQLVKSLSSNEKRHFRLLANIQKGEKNYLLVFDELLEMEEYDRAFLINKFNAFKFIKSLHVTENYLYQRIMESLRLFYENQNTNALLKNLLFDAELLEKRGLYLLSLSILKKAEKLAYTHHKHLYILEILTRKIKIIVAYDRKLLIEQIEENYTELNKICTQLAQEMQHRYLHHWFLLTFRKWRNPKEEGIQTIMKKRYNELCLIPYPKEGTFYAQYYYLTAQSTFLHTIQDFEESDKIYQQIALLWEKHPAIIQANTQNYLTQLANYISNSIMGQKYDLAKTLIAKMEEITTHNFDEEGEKFQNVYYFKQFYHLNLKEFAQACTLTANIEIGLKKFDPKINKSRRLSLYYNTTVAHFLNGDYQHAADWLNKILAVTRTDEPRKDIQQFARILQLAIYYKLSSNEVLEYMFRSIYRNKTLKQQMHQFEKIVLNYFKKLINIAPQSKEERKLFEELFQKLTSLENSEKKVLGFQEFCLWLEIVKSPTP